MPRNMSPIPKANEPGNNPKSSGEGGDELEPPPQDYNSVLNAGDMSSDEDDSDDGGGGVGGEDSQYGGYQLLLQDPENLDDESTEQDEDDEGGDESAVGAQPHPIPTEHIEDFMEQEMPSSISQATDSGNAQQPNLPTHLAKLLPTASPTPDVGTQVTHTDTQMSLEQRKNAMAADDQIREAMAGFSLPMAAVPPWAQSVEENAWKEQLVARIERKQDRQQRTGGVTQQKGKS